MRVYVFLANSYRQSLVQLHFRLCRCVIYSLLICLLRSAVSVPLVMSVACSAAAGPGAPMGSRQATGIAFCQEGTLANEAGWVSAHLQRGQEVNHSKWDHHLDLGEARASGLTCLLLLCSPHGAAGVGERRGAAPHCPRKEDSCPLLLGSNVTGKRQY